MRRLAFRVVHFEEKYIEVYEKCFSNPEWLFHYGIDFQEFDFEDYLKTAVLTAYPAVERLIILYNEKPILFAHICHEEERCVLVGGLVPELRNSGRGIYCSVLIIDPIFKTKAISTILVNVLKTNVLSIKMLKRLGFDEVSTFRERPMKKRVLTIQNTAFPNEFCTLLLCNLTDDNF